jgi:type IV pilus assembly protein PilA
MGNMLAIQKALGAKRDALKANEEKGFTLIELLVVVLIIGILAAIAVPVYLGIQDNAMKSAVTADLGNVKTAIVAHNTDNNGAYPTTIDALTTIQVDGANYTATGTPAWIGTASNSGWCVVAQAKNDEFFVVTDATAPKSAGATAPADIAACKAL